MQQLCELKWNIKILTGMCVALEHILRLEIIALDTKLTEIFWIQSSSPAV